MSLQDTKNTVEVVYYFIKFHFITEFQVIFFSSILKIFQAFQILSATKRIPNLSSLFLHHLAQEPS